MADFPAPLFVGQPVCPATPQPNSPATDDLTRSREAREDVENADGNLLLRALCDLRVKIRLFIEANVLVFIGELTAG